MPFLLRIPLFAFCTFLIRAHRDSDSGGHQVAGRIAIGATSDADARASLFARAKSEVRRELQIRKLRAETVEKCRMAQEAKESGNATKETVKTLGTCISSLAEIARETQQQRDKSREANRHYAEDMMMAKKIMAYLETKLNVGQREFEKYRQTEKSQERELAELMQRLGVDPNTGSVDGSRRFVSSLQTQQVGIPRSPVLMAVNPAYDGNVAALFSPNGQSFGVSPVSGALVGQPSLLQVAAAPPWYPAAVTADIQARLDWEAGKLEESDIFED